MSGTTEDEDSNRSAAPGLILGAAVLFVAAVLVLSSDPGAPPVTRGAPAPGFDLPRLPPLAKANVENASGNASATDTDPKQSSMALSDLEGRVVLLNFWATWCEPCESEMPAMERLYEALPKDRFEMVAISIDAERDVVETFVQEYRLSFPILLDRDQATYKAYQTMGVPETLLIDQQGNIVERYVGPKEWDAREYVGRIRELIDGRDAAAGSAPAAPGPL